MSDTLAMIVAAILIATDLYGTVVTEVWKTTLAGVLNG